MRNESITAADLFKFDYFKCLRSDYAKNECSFCIDICPEEAMVFDRTRLTLDPERCTGCSACMGGCPTEALMSDLFDPNRFVLEFSASKDHDISCKENVPCLAALSPEHLVSIVLRKSGGITCDLSHCEGCAINKENKARERIDDAIDEAGKFLQLCNEANGIEKREQVSGNDVALDRRGMFKKLFRAAQEIQEEASMAELVPPEHEKQPVKRIILKNSLKRVAERFEANTGADTSFSFVVGKKIDADTCTNCQECAMFCPTEALSILKDNTGIVFQVGKCIACGICNDLCQPRSISDDTHLDLVNFAFDRMELLVKHRLEVCEECKIAFPYRGGEKICDRCRDYKDHFSDLFTMAKDLE
jgi:energy-converting hydrogenase A subunit P